MGLFFKHLYSSTVKLTVVYKVVELHLIQKSKIHKLHPKNIHNKLVSCSWHAIQFSKLQQMFISFNIYNAGNLNAKM